jgi:hypothetical protein
MFSYWLRYVGVPVFYYYYYYYSAKLDLPALEPTFVKFNAAVPELYHSPLHFRGWAHRSTMPFLLP